MDDLIARLENGDGADGKLHKDILSAVGICVHARTHRVECDNDGYDFVCSDCGTEDLWLGLNPTSSLDAAVAFVERMLPGWYWRAGVGSHAGPWAHLNRVHPDNCLPGDEATSYAKSPARALMAAALRALSPTPAPKEDQ